MSSHTGHGPALPVVIGVAIFHSHLCLLPLFMAGPLVSQPLGGLLIVTDIGLPQEMWGSGLCTHTCLLLKVLSAVNGLPTSQMGGNTSYQTEPGKQSLLRGRKWLFYRTKFSKIMLKVAPIGNNKHDLREGKGECGRIAVTVGMVPATSVLIIGESGIICAVSN